MKRLCFFVVLSVGICLARQAQPSHGSAEQDQHMADVHRHGEMAMGFSQTSSTHHFRLTDQGGYIQVQANDPNDTETQDMIRMHLQHVSQAFKAGDFSAPQLTHSQTPPGVPTMKRLRSDIEYRYEPMQGGGRLVIRTKNPEALGAVHQFLAFQIKDHQTGDKMEVQK